MLAIYSRLRCTGVRGAGAQVSERSDRSPVGVDRTLVARDVAGRPGGRPPLHSKREIINAILYLTRAGCAWRMMPNDLPPWRTVYGYFADWRDDGTLDLVHDTLPRGAAQEDRKSATVRRGGPSPPRGSSIRNPCVGPTPSERTGAVMTPARRCRAQSAIS